MDHHIQTFINSEFCPHSFLMCFVWISEQTVTPALYSINRIDLNNRGGVCLQRGTDWVVI
jgi:hypothetical protein